MQARFLGDAKDSFKWHYHDYLASRLALPRLSIALMMNPDGTNAHGRTCPEEFPADPCVLDFCRDLRKSKDVEGIKALPGRTGAGYEVRLHRGSELLSHQSRRRYFADFDASCEQLALLDPDNGFEPEQSFSAQHVRYEDVRQVLDQLTDGSVISVFQHFRYVTFADDYARISERLGSCPSTAIYWHQHSPTTAQATLTAGWCAAAGRRDCERRRGRAAVLRHRCPSSAAALQPS